MKITNLYRRSSGIYYARIYIPVELIGQFNRREYVRSLRTREESEAYYRLGIYRAGMMRAMAMAQKDASLAKRQLEIIERRIYRAAIKRYERLWDYERLPDWDRDMLRNSHADMAQNLRRIMAGGEYRRNTAFVCNAFKNQILQPDPEEASFDEFAEIGIRALLSAECALHDRVTRHDDPSDHDREFAACWAMSLSLLKFVGQASLVDEAMLPS